MWVCIAAVVTLLHFSAGAQYQLTTKNPKDIKTLMTRNLLDGESIDLQFTSCYPKINIFLQDQPKYKQYSNYIALEFEKDHISVYEMSFMRKKILNTADMPRSWSCNKSVKIRVSWALSQLIMTQDCGSKVLVNLPYRTSWKIKGVSVSSDKEMRWTYGEGICPKKGTPSTRPMTDSAGNTVRAVHSLSTTSIRDIKPLDLGSLKGKTSVDIQYTTCHNKINIFLHEDRKVSERWGKSIRFSLDESEIDVTENNGLQPEVVQTKFIEPWPCGKPVRITASWKEVSSIARLLISKDCGKMTVIDIPHKMNLKVKAVSVSSMHPVRVTYGEGICPEKGTPNTGPTTDSTGKSGDCPPGTVSEGSSCVIMCSSNAQCKPNNVCRQGTCIPTICQNKDCSDLDNTNHGPGSTESGMITETDQTRNNSKSNVNPENKPTNKPDKVNTEKNSHHNTHDNNHKPQSETNTGDNSETNQSQADSSGMSESTASSSAGSNIPGNHTTNHTATGHGLIGQNNSGVKTLPSTDIVFITVASVVSTMMYG